MGNTNKIKKRCIEKALKYYENLSPHGSKASYVQLYSDKLYKRYVEFYRYYKEKRHILGYE